LPTLVPGTGINFHCRYEAWRTIFIKGKTLKYTTAWSGYEAFPSRETTIGERPSIDLNYIILGTRDDVVARSFLADSTPTVYSNLLRQTLQLKEVAPEVWECTVRYGAMKMPEAGDRKWEFDTTGGTQKITQSKQNIGNYAPAGKTAPDFKGAVGVTEDSVEGCEIIVPQFKWSETHQLDAAVATWEYSQTLYNLTGKTNIKEFRGFGIKQVLFSRACHTVHVEMSHDRNQQTPLAVGAEVFVTPRDSRVFVNDY
jgi:hypothetical protein